MTLDGLVRGRGRVRAMGRFRVKVRVRARGRLLVWAWVWAGARGRARVALDGLAQLDRAPVRLEEVGGHGDEHGGRLRDVPGQG